MFKTAIALTVLLLTLGASQAHGCVCGSSSMPPPKDNEELVRRILSKADYIFVGKVTGFGYRKGIVNDFVERERISNPSLTYEAIVANLSVERWWKGAPGPEVTLMTQGTRNSDGTESNTTCDYNFKKGETYLVFASMQNGYLQTDSCSRTRPTSTTKDLDLLGPGNPPVEFKKDQ